MGKSLKGMLKKAARGVLALLPCSRTYEYAPHGKRAAALLDRPFGKTQACFFEHSLPLMQAAYLEHLWVMNLKYSTDPLPVSKSWWKVSEGSNPTPLTS